MNKKEILAIIPARGGSKGLPGKNIKLLGHKPLIAYTIEATQRSKYIKRMIVSTDDLKIAEISKEYGAEVPFIRPAELSNDYTNTVDVVIHALNDLKEKEGYIPKLVVLLQPTSPLRNHIHIDEAIEKFLESTADSVISVCEFEHSPYWATKIVDNRLIKLMDEKNKRRQDYEKIYRYNGAIYIIAAKDLLENKSFFDEVAPYIMDNEDSIDIDTLFDFKMAEMILNMRNERSFFNE
ncbi:MAG: acylneuraminate cytidylyltransferase family protein [Marinisporobacter sp.]|jgi:N-acylneuraminate cytidylyltransferase/CMP-N,N'-diacetyllegionaminic acid synthase|nr:acylneuraminate cytidylyltransferase family protein [Marinisporobacter sp.]